MNRTMTVITVAAAATVATLAPVTASSPEPAHVTRWMTTPCEYEDSINCYWDATEAGNGTGHSFYSVKVGNKVCTLFWGPRYARKHNDCTKI